MIEAAVPPQTASHEPAGLQGIELSVNRDTFSRELAPARTFGFTKDFPGLQAMGLIRGGSLENAIVLTENGMLNDTSLRFPDEFVRHKILDLLGDFALIGQAVLGRLIDASADFRRGVEAFGSKAGRAPWSGT